MVNQRRFCQLLNLGIGVKRNEILSSNLNQSLLVALKNKSFS